MQKKKQFIGFTVLFAVSGVGLLVAAFATDNWVQATPACRICLDNSGNVTRDTAYKGNSTFGLFNGHQTLDYGSGLRPYPLNIACDPAAGYCAYIYMRTDTEGTAVDKLKKLITQYQHQNQSGSGNDTHSDIEYGLFSFSMWAAVLAMLSLAIVMGLVNIGFSVFNVFGRPIETITGPLGLYLWNSLSLLCTVVVLALYGGLYGTQLSKNFMMHDDYSQGWRSEGHSKLDFSFYFLLGSAGAFLVNFLLLFLGGQSLSCSYSKAGEKEVDNGMILY